MSWNRSTTYGGEVPEQTGEKQAGIGEDLEQDRDGDGPGVEIRGSKGVATPGVASAGVWGQAGEGEVRRQAGESTFRAAAARGDYLGQDRMVMKFAAKEVSRFMSKPEKQDWSSAKRLARYLKDNKRVVIECKYQKLPEKAIAWSDTGSAGCMRERGGQHQEV